MTAPASQLPPDPDHHENSGNESGNTALVLIPQPHGGALLSGGQPGNRGGTGRPANRWKQQMANVLERAKVPAVLERMISGDILEHLGDSEAGPIIGETRNADRLNAIKFVAEYAEGKPDQHTDLDVSIRVVHDEPTDG